MNNKEGGEEGWDRGGMEMKHHGGGQGRRRGRVEWVPKFAKFFLLFLLDVLLLLILFVVLLFLFLVVVLLLLFLVN
jgi:hypothetical protein